MRDSDELRLDLSAAGVHPGGHPGRLQLLPRLPDGQTVPGSGQELSRTHDGPRGPCLHISSVLFLHGMA